MAKPTKQKTLNSGTPKVIDHSTTLGNVECLDGSIIPRDLVEIFDQISHRRGANEHAYLMDYEVRRYIANLLRERLPRSRKREVIA